MRAWLRQRLVAHGAMVAPLALLQALSIGGTAAAPALHDAPLLLVGLTPRLPFLALAARDSTLVPFLLIATARLCVADPIHFRMGQRIGTWTRNPRERHRVAERLISRATALTETRHAHLLAGVLVFLRPISRHLTLAGATGVRGPAVAVLDVAGTVAYLLAIRAAGAALW